MGWPRSAVDALVGKRPDRKVHIPPVDGRATFGAIITCIIVRLIRGVSLDRGENVMRQFLIVAALIAACPAHAEEGYSVYGPGAKSCEVWTLRLDKHDEHSRDVLWLEGFLSASGMFIHLRRTDSSAMDTWVTQYCGGHPLEDLQKAAEALANELAH
jgi:hypothetical protein